MSVVSAMADTKSPFLTQRYPLAEDGAIIVVAAMVFEGDEAMFPGCLMYHRDRPDGSSQALVPVRTKRSAAEMDDPLDPITSKFWVTSLPAEAKMGSGKHAIVAGVCVSEPPREPGTVQLALMVSGVATLQTASELSHEPSPGELLAVVLQGDPPGERHVLQIKRFLPPEASFLLYWPRHIKSGDVFGTSGNEVSVARKEYEDARRGRHAAGTIVDREAARDAEAEVEPLKRAYLDMPGPFEKLVTDTVLETPSGAIRDFNPTDKPKAIVNAAKWLAYMADKDPGEIFDYLVANQEELNRYVHPFGAFARVLDSGPHNTLRVLVSGTL